ncbi:MAG: HD domain-containing protein [Deltaproteobacteria bacterium]|nr:HD domain-containing protein [Deltaproteobacteria bacterium]
MVNDDRLVPAGDSNLPLAPARRRVEKFATGFIKALFRILKIARLHDVNNKALVHPIQDFVSKVEDGLRILGPINFKWGIDIFKVNDIRLRLDDDSFNLARLMADNLRERGIGSLYLSRNIEGEQVKDFLKMYLTAPHNREAYDLLNRELDKAGIPIRTGPLSMGTGEGGYEMVDVDRRVHALILYGRMVALMKRVVAGMEDKSEVKILSRRLQRCTQGLVDLCEAEAHSIIGLAQIKDYDDYEYHHVINVAVLSIVLGREIGLERTELNELASCALFYDIGTFKIPNDVLYKRGKLSEDEWNVIKRHPMLTVSTILKMQGFAPSILKRLIVGFEHHIGYDGSGYPTALKGWKTDLYTRILSIADAFDAMTSRRPNREPIPPDQAMRKLEERSGKLYDPALVKVFINCMGLFPAGSVVQLSDDTFGVVILPGKAPDFDRPKVKILVQSSGKPVNGAVIDLAEKNSNGTYKISVKRLADPVAEKLPVPRYLVGVH